MSEQFQQYILGLESITYRIVCYASRELKHEKVPPVILEEVKKLIQLTKPVINACSYSYQIGLGNNHELIRALFKTRWWSHELHSFRNQPNKLNFSEV
jgi:hypothetical protein